MKAITDKIIEAIESRYNSVIFDEKTENEFSAIAFKEGLLVAINEIKHIEKYASFEDCSRLLIKHLNKPNYHPHHTAIVTSTSAELFEAKISTGKIVEYLND